MTGRPAPKRGGRTQVDHLCTCGYAAAVLCALNDPTISHGSIDTMVAGLFNVFLLNLFGLAGSDLV